MKDLLTKKLLAMVLSTVLWGNFCGVCTYAMPLPIKKTDTVDVIISSKLEKEIKSSIAKIYGQDEVDVIYANIERIA
ncbi:hypothetical protein IJZ97_01320, partial [bacterium]|nr:hypothetical protein [bacterium]